MKTPERVKPNRRWMLLAGLLCFFIGTPFLLYLIAVCSNADWTFRLIIPILMYWMGLPAIVLGPRFFVHAEVGASPLGIMGWAAGVLFYAAIAILFWAAIRGILALRKPRAI